VFPREKPATTATPGNPTQPIPLSSSFWMLRGRERDQVSLIKAP